MFQMFAVVMFNKTVGESNKCNIVYIVSIHKGILGGCTALWTARLYITLALCLDAILCYSLCTCNSCLALATFDFRRLC